MTDLALLLVGSLLVNNFVLAQFLGLCPFMGITRRAMTRHWRLAFATTFDAHLSSHCVTTLCIPRGILVPLELDLPAHHSIHRGHSWSGPSSFAYYLQGDLTGTASDCWAYICL